MPFVLCLTPFTDVFHTYEGNVLPRMIGVEIDDSILKMVTISHGGNADQCQFIKLYKNILSVIFTSVFNSAPHPISFLVFSS